MIDPLRRERVYVFI